MDLTLAYIAIYARFSSARQDERSIDDQVRRCREHLGADCGAIQVFADYAVSGASLNRPAFEALMAAVDAGKVTSIVTEDISRISRDFADAAQIFKRLQYVGVPLVGVADGIDTSSKHAKLTFTLESLVADLYLDDLRDKTLRGLEGRALAGYATGAVPFGYRTHACIDASGRELGRQISIDKAAARLIVRIFTEYAAGRGMSSIAKALNLDGIASPRAKTKHRFAGWMVGTIRAMLRNERYIGVWRFKATQWVKVPGSNRRLPRNRPPNEVIVRERPDLVIVDLPLWEAVHQRIALGHPLRGRVRLQARYLLSGFLVCATCEAPMTMIGRATDRNPYYRCGSTRTKAICSNNVSIRASSLLDEVLGGIREGITGSKCVKSALKEHGGRGIVLRARVREREQALTATEAKISRLVDFLVDGERLDYAHKKLRELELYARSQKAELEMLRRELKKPLRKVSAKDVGAAVSSLGAVGQEKIDGARERLRRWLGRVPIRFDGEILVIQVIPAALVADVARDGAAAPNVTLGEPLELRFSITHLLARVRCLPEALASQRASVATVET